MTIISPEAQARQDAARDKRSGQFGAQHHSAPEAGLATLDPDTIDARIARSEEMQKERDDARTIIRSITEAANVYTNRGGLSHERDDIIGTTIVDVIGQQSRGTSHVTDRPFLWFATRAVTSRMHDGGVHHTTLKGRSDLADAITLSQEQLGRTLTQREIEELAEDVRVSYPVGRRPAKGYHRKDVIFSLDYASAPDGVSPLADVIPDEKFTSDYATSTAKAVEAVEALNDETSSYSKADARKNAWNLVADKTDAPMVAVCSVKDDRQFRALIDEYGGPAEAARQWRSGDAGEDVEEALFAPFGDLDSKQMEKVSDMLVRYSQHADDLWSGAMKAAVDVTALRKTKREEARAAAKAQVAE